MAYSHHRPDLIRARIVSGNLRLERTISGHVWHRDVGPDDMVSLMETAVVLGVHRPTVYDWIRRGLLQAFESEYGLLLRWRDIRKLGQDRGVFR